MSTHEAILEPRWQSLKQATNALIRAAGGQEAAAAETGKSQAQVNRYQNVNTEDFATVQVVAKLEAVTQGMPGAPHVTRWLARELGFALVPLPVVSDATVWGRRTGMLMQEAGDIINGIGRAIEGDNDVDPDEAKALIADADELVAIACEIANALKRRAEGKF